MNLIDFHNIQQVHYIHKFLFYAFAFFVFTVYCDLVYGQFCNVP